jgi:hypothetical protein
MSDINSVSSENMLEEITEYAKLLRETADDWSNVDAPGLRSLAEFIESFPARIYSAHLAGMEEAKRIVLAHRSGMFTGWTTKARRKYVVAGRISMEDAEKIARDGVKFIADGIQEIIDADRANTENSPSTAPSPIQTALDTEEPEKPAHGASTGQEGARNG